MLTPVIFKKLAIFTDIHFGRKGNSRQHNQDCLDFIAWFCTQVKGHGYSHVVFMGDWFESRSALNIETLEYSYRGLKMLNELGIPVKFIVGNHDLHRRTTRDIHSVRIFQELENIHVIDKVTVEDGLLFSPYLFEEEYKDLIPHNDKWAWLGHFEFKGFVVTGQGHALDHGPDHKLFSGPKKIMSGHFHKRQNVDNVFYTGNAFPMDFGDAGDWERGMASYYVQENKLTYTNWSNCPKYIKTTLSSVVEDKWHPLPRMKVKCIIDTELGYQDAQALRTAMIEAHHLRDFILEEDRAAKQGLLEGDGVTVTDALPEFTGIDELVISQLQLAKDDKKLKIDIDLLVEIYKDLEVEATDDNE